MLGAAETAYAIWKYILSFRRARRNWTLDDYPLRVTHHDFGTAPREGQPLPWMVTIVNWFQMLGAGGSLSEARTQLDERFAEYVASGQPLPRPGTGRPIEIVYASTDEIDRLDDLAREFMPKILGYERDACLITDESSISDFTEPHEEYLRKMGVIYGLHPSELADLKLVTILKKIAEKRGV